MLNDLIGKSFQWGGRGPDNYDCYGLVKEIYARQGIELPDYPILRFPDEIDEAITYGSEQFDQLERPEPYCVVALCVRPPYVSHVGVVLPNLYQFIHVMRKVNVCIERLDSPEWKHRIRGYYRWHKKL